MPPPLELALLPEKVLFVAVSTLSLRIAPPLAALLFEKVLFVTINLPLLRMAPPPMAALPEKVHSFIVTVVVVGAELIMAPPLPLEKVPVPLPPLSVNLWRSTAPLVRALLM